MAHDNASFQNEEFGSGSQFGTPEANWSSKSISTGITYSWNCINARVSKKSSGDTGHVSKDDKLVLTNVTGVVRPGELLAVIGPSGAGKSSLFNALTFKAQELNVSGSRYINGVTANPDSLTAISAYVQQNDMFIGSLTVREHLVFQAQLLMDQSIIYEHKIERVDEVLHELGLKKCSNTLIGTPGRIKGISGGEMKRLSFASEILTDPPLMFCDEPTSGLDSNMAQTVVSVLRNLANRGKTVLCTIHSPSSQTFSMFDQLLLLAEGRVAYMGDAKKAIAFFDRNGHSCPRNYNPSDFYIKTLAIEPENEDECKSRIHQICDAFQQSAENRAIEDSSITLPSAVTVEFLKKKSKVLLYKASRWSQFKVLLWRSWITNMKDPFFLKMKIVQTLFMSFMVGIIFFGQNFDQAGIQNINGALFISLMNMSFDNAYGTIGIFCLELPIFKREHFNGMYRTDTYFVAKMLAEIPFYIFLPIISMAIVYFMVGMQPDVMIFLLTAAIYVLVVNCAVSLGYMASCIANSVSVALTVTPILMVPLVIFGGFFYNAGSIPSYMSWIKYISWFYYGNEAIMITQWRNVDSILCNLEESTCPENGQQVLLELGFDENNLMFDIYALMGLVVVFRVLAYVALLAKTFRK